MLTAFRSGNKDNMKNLRELKALLLKDGYSVTEISGHYVEDYGTDKAKDVKEISLFVADHKETGNLKQALVKYGKKYDQDSVFYKPKDKDDKADFAAPEFIEKVKEKIHGLYQSIANSGFRNFEI